MHALRSCDFCDADAVGTFEVVPPELDPAPAERRRTLLCPACRDHLETLLEPLLERVRSGDVTDADGGDHLATATVDEAAPDVDADSSDEGEGSDGGTESESEDADPVTAADGTGAATVDAGDEETDGRSASGTSTTRETPPEHYGKVVRLLRNREFPMKRAGFESLAANAYDLDEDAVERVVDYAIDRGALLQRGSDLHRP